MLSGNSLRQTVHTHCASVNLAAKLVAALLMVARVTAGLAESNGSLPPGLRLTSPAGWLPRTRISYGTLRSATEYGLPFFLRINDDTQATSANLHNSTYIIDTNTRHVYDRLFTSAISQRVPVVSSMHTDNLRRQEFCHHYRQWTSLPVSLRSSDVTAETSEDISVQLSWQLVM